MRGNPLWQLLWIVVAFVLMGVPVWRLTRPAQARTSGLTGGGVDAPTLAATATAAPVMLEVSAEFVPLAAEFALSYLGDTVLQGKAQAKASAAWKVVLPAEGADVVLHAVWSPMAGAGAARVRVRWSDGREMERLFWAGEGGTLDTVVTVPGDVSK